MNKMNNVIFYEEHWGSNHVVKKLREVDSIPNVDEMVVISDDGPNYVVVERVFDYADNIVHIRLSASGRTFNLSVM